MKHILLSFILISFLSNESIAQKGWELGGWLGTSWYYGDLNTTLIPRKPGLALGLNARYNFNTRVSARGSASFGTVAAADSLSRNNFEKARNLSFKSNIYDVSGIFEFNFFEYVHGSKDAFWTPYTLVGINVFKFNPRAELDGEYYDLRNLGTEGQEIGEEYYTVSGGYVLGLGIKWDINIDWSLNIEFSTRRLFTDYLDDVSTVYANPEKLLLTRGEISPQLADRSLELGLGEPNRQRGNTNDKDVYNFFGISLMRYFGDIECPKISNTKW